jgi:hypothetical protein
MAALLVGHMGWQHRWLSAQNAAVVATSQRAYPAKSLCLPHRIARVAVSCSICMLILALIYTVLYLTMTNTLRKVCIVPQAIKYQLKQLPG